jgi:hypothetical protein
VQRGLEARSVTPPVEVIRMPSPSAPELFYATGAAAGAGERKRAAL